MANYIDGIPILWDDEQNAKILGPLFGGAQAVSGMLQRYRSLLAPVVQSAQQEYDWQTYWSHELAEKYFGGNKKTSDDAPVEVTDETEIYNSLKPDKQAVFYTDNDADNQYDSKKDIYRFDIKVFVSHDGAKLLRAWKGAPPKPDELLVFLENNEGDVASTGQILVRAGSNVEMQLKDYAGNKNLYHWLNSIHKINRDELVGLLKSAGSKNYFIRILKKVLNVAVKIIVLPIKALAEAFTWVGKQIEKIKIEDNTWKKDHTGDIKKWLEEQEEVAFKKFVDFFKGMPVDGLPAQKNFEAKLPGIMQQLREAFGSVNALLEGGVALALDVLFALVCGVINAIIDLIAGIFIFIGMLLNLTAGIIQTEAEAAANLHYYNSLAMEYIDNFTQAFKKVDWNKVVQMAVTEYIVLMYITLPQLLLKTTLNPREIGYYIGYIGINIVICFIPIVDLVQLAKIKEMTEPFRRLFEAILNLVKKGGRAVAKTAGGLLRLFEDFTEMLRSGTEEVVNFVKKIFAAVKAWFEELLGVRKSYIFRIQGGVLPNASKYRFIIDKFGKLFIDGDEMVHVIFNDRKRVFQFWSKRGKTAELFEAEIEQSFIDKIKRDAVPQSRAKEFPDKPQIDDPAKSKDAFGIPKNYFEEMLKSIKNPKNIKNE